MSIQICLLKTGETIVADIKEVIDTEKDESLGYKVSNPFVVEFQYTNITKVDDEKVEEIEESDNDIKFKPWAPLARKTEFNFPHEFISVIYDPHESIVNSYISIIAHFTEKFKKEIIVNTPQTVISYGNEDNNVGLKAQEINDQRANGEDE
jgi:hypothetical protein